MGNEVRVEVSDIVSQTNTVLGHSTQELDARDTGRQVARVEFGVGSVTARPSWRERVFEVMVSLVLALLFVFKVLQPEWVFITLYAVLCIGWATFEWYRHGVDIFWIWGLRFTGRAVLWSFVLPGLFSFGATVVIVVSCITLDKDISVNWHFWLLAGLYPFWGVLQQLLLQGIFTRDLNWCFTCSDERTVGERADWRGVFMALCVCLLSALVFALLHWPDMWLMGGTGILGLPWALFFLYQRSILPLGIFQGLLGTVYCFWFLQWDPIESTFGPA